MFAALTRSSSKSSSAETSDELDFLENGSPMGYAGGDTNLTSYVGNDPTNATDPTGLESTALVDNLVSTFEGAVGLMTTDGGSGGGTPVRGGNGKDGIVLFANPGPLAPINSDGTVTVYLPGQHVYGVSDTPEPLPWAPPRPNDPWPNPDLPANAFAPKTIQDYLPPEPQSLESPLLPFRPEPTPVLPWQPPTPPVAETPQFIPNGPNDIQIPGLHFPEHIVPDAGQQRWDDFVDGVEKRLGLPRGTIPRGEFKPPQDDRGIAPIYTPATPGNAPGGSGIPEGGIKIPFADGNVAGEITIGTGGSVTKTITNPADAARKGTISVEGTIRLYPEPDPKKPIKPFPYNVLPGQ